jgi:hypothetical protein
MLDRVTRSSIIYFGERGFHASLIADKTGLEKGQVYYACRKLGIRLRDYRNGLGEVAERIVAVAPCVRVRTVRRRQRVTA